MGDCVKRFAEVKESDIDVWIPLSEMINACFQCVYCMVCAVISLEAELQVIANYVVPKFLTKSIVKWVGENST